MKGYKYWFVKRPGLGIGVMILLVFILVGILAPYLANEHPLYCSGEIEENDINNNCISTLIPYSPGTIDKSAIAVGPDGWGSKHILGTDVLGRDLFSGLIHGTRTSLLIGFGTVLFALLFGGSLGLLAGYFGNDRWKTHPLTIILGSIVICITVFYLVFETRYRLLVLVVGLLLMVLNSYFSRFLMVKTKRCWTIPIDNLIVKCIEVRKSIPGLFILLACLPLFAQPSKWNIILIITILMWTEFARHIRSETIAIKNSNHIISSSLLGIQTWKLVFSHILPNMVPTILILVCFNASSAIILESSLSFLGIGLPVEEVSWGRMLADGRSSKLWWMVVFPGLCITLVVLALFFVSDFIQEKVKGR